MIEQALIKTLGFGSQEFIERAVKGGYRLQRDDTTSMEEAIAYYSLEPESTLLSPAAWKSVGKTEGWLEDDYRVSFGSDYPKLATRFSGFAYTMGTWQWNMHRFIDALAEEESSKA